MCAPTRTRTHAIRLSGQRVILRPLTENDWDLLLEWNHDPDVLYFAEADHVTSRSLPEVQAIYRHVSQSAYCFIAEADGRAIGECWLQQMNLPRILARHPEADCRRIDLLIGEKTCWGRGYGTEMIRLLTAFAFEREHADYVFGCDIADDNIRSLRAFKRVGYSVDPSINQPADDKALRCYDLVISKPKWTTLRRANQL